jgi:alpha-glucoside transport system permease protein
MVILSAAIKGVPVELTEAARIDGATELQAFYRITLPSIKGSIITVYTTIAIAVLKVFDIIFVTTGGNLDTSVVAVRMYQEMFRFRNFGQATTMAVILLLAVIPIMVINIRNLRRQGIGS